MPRSSRNLRCEQVIDHLESWIDGELENGFAEEMNRHVQSCSQCQAEYELAAQIQARLGRLPAFDLPPEVLDRVRSETEGNSGSRRVAGWLHGSAIRPAAKAAAIGAMALLLGVVVTGRRTPAPQLSTAEVETVTAQTRLALAYLGDVARRAESGTAARVVEERALVSTISEISKSLSWALESEEGKTTEKRNEGSL